MDEEIEEIEEIDRAVEFYRANDTELQNHEYFKESVDSAKRIGSISLNLSKWVEFGNVSLKDYYYLANQLKDSNIENLKIERFLTNDDELTAISTVLKHSKIKNLTLNPCEFRRDGLLAFSSALKESKIENLELRNKLSYESDTIHILINSLPFSNVTLLKLDSIFINFSCLKHLSNTLASTKITILSLKSCNIIDGIEYLSTKLSSSKIQSLNLANNTMSFNSLKSLADVLENTAITELNISHNGIESTGATYLAEKLSKSIVQNLDIGYNPITSEGCLAIGNVIHLTKIIKLILRRNFIDSSGITSLAENLKKSNVKYLNLDLNNLQINGAQILANGIKDSKLEYLNVNNNQLSNVGMGIILDALQFTRITDFDLNCESNGMIEENMKFVTNEFKFFKLKNLKLTLPKDKNIVQIFFKELKTLIESDKLDEILSIKNKMNLLIDFDFNFMRDTGVGYILDVIKHFHMKKLIFNNHYIDYESSVSSIIKVLIDVKNPLSNITTLNLSSNIILDYTAEILAKNFKYLKLTRLELSQTAIENDGVIAIANELKNSKIRYLNLARNRFTSKAASYLTSVVEKHPVRIRLDCRHQNGFSAEDQLVIKNINYMFFRAQLLIRAISDNSPVKYDKDLLGHLKAYEIFKNVDLLWESRPGEHKYDYNKINSQIRSNVTRNFLKIIGVVNSDTIYSNLLPTEIIIMICSFLNINDIKFN